MDTAAGLVVGVGGVNVGTMGIRALFVGRGGTNGIMGVRALGALGEVAMPYVSIIPAP